MTRFAVYFVLSVEKTRARDLVGNVELVREA